MAKIGVLVFTKNVMLSGRADRKRYYFDSYSYTGLNKILNELECEYEYCSIYNIDRYEYILISVISYLDLINIVRHIPIERKCKIIIGGPACNNIKGILSYIDIACFGRCDLGLINKIINQEKIDNVWYKKNDPEFQGEYIVGTSKIESLGGNEKSVGCKNKCFFCFYSYWNKYVGVQDNYTSGFGVYEDFIQSLDWEKCKRGGVSAIDGITEETRLRVNKNIKYNDLINSLLNSNNVDFGSKKLRLKLYCIVGFPWEDRNEIEKLDLIRAVKQVCKDLKNKIVIKMHISHFIPFQKTPMWDCKFNFNNYQKWSKSNIMLLDTGNVQVYSGGCFNPSPASAAVSTVFQRAEVNSKKDIKIICSKKFESLNTDQKIIYLSKNMGGYFNKQEKETIKNIKTEYKYDKNKT